MPGHRQIDHTADLALEIWADDESTLLIEAARAVVGILTEDAELPEATTIRMVELETLDAEDRLVQWLNEIIVLAVGESFICTGAELDLHEDGLRAQLRGLPDAGDRVRTELKAATYHDLSLTRTADGVRARVVIDV